ncbi:MAG: sigma 54-interacting transcriptional regulator [Deltaproteobacteria bacterium]|nr:sigma 54-interacting transcriptional regulator [Deltaproteobacteria bacterium]
MLLRSLKGRLIIAVSSLVVGSGLLISLLVGERHRSSLLETMMAQGESIALAIALETADKVLINDLAGLQKMIEHQMGSHNGIGYLFVQRGNEILAHSFRGGLPTNLVKANRLAPDGRQRLQKIVSTDGIPYLDIAWPVFEGKAGVLRLGLVEKPYQDKVRRLWLEMGLLTAGILFLAVIGTLFFIRRITGPLSTLTRAMERIDRGETGVRVTIQGTDEVGSLASSFNRMVARIEDYTRMLKEKTQELIRSNQQTRTFCNVIREIGALRSLKEIGVYLIKQFQAMLPSPTPMAFLLLTNNREGYWVISENTLKWTDEPGKVASFSAQLKEVRETIETGKGFPRLPKEMDVEGPQLAIPLRFEEQTFGLLIFARPKEYDAGLKEVESLELTLNQCSGVIHRALQQEEGTRNMEKLLEAAPEFQGIVGRDPKMQSIFRLIEDIAPTDATVLIQGESGTGKEMVARAIHHLSQRRDKPFIVIDCSAYPATLLESELFGHEKGAFTGATRQKIGRFEKANGGTVFLDEIGEIPPSAQIKLLRILQTQSFERLGGEKTLTVNVHFLAATNKDLLQEVKAGRFREDLYYRLNVIPLNLPPLRERPNDIPLLARRFLRHFSEEQNKSVQDFSPEALRLMLTYPWPGNVRELENSVEHAVVLAKGTRIEALDLPANLKKNAPPSRKGGQPSGLATMAEKEQEVLFETLEKCQWNKKEAAGNLGISRNTLYQKMKRYGISRPTTH